MSVSEINTVDMAEVLTYAYEIGDMINASVEVADYLYWKQAVEGDPMIQALIKSLSPRKSCLKRLSGSVTFTRTTIRPRMK